MGEGLAAGLDVAQRVDPDATADNVGVAVRIAGVIDVARLILPTRAINSLTT